MEDENMKTFNNLLKVKPAKNTPDIDDVHLWVEAGLEEDIPVPLDLDVGRKFDDGKDRWDLLPVAPVREIVKVLSFGSRKYEDNNWMHINKPLDRYYAATFRHMTTWWEGERNDPDSGYHHLAHACCCLIFAMWHDWKDGK